jgi:hypothetical protein
MEEARVKSVRTLQPRVRSLVTITYAADDLEGFLTLTDDHALKVRRGCRVARPAYAADVCAGDFVLVPRGEAKVVGVEHVFENTAVVEVAFEEEDQVAHASAPGSPLPVAVYGSCAMHVVKILKFKRYDDFRALFFDSEDLKQCRDTLRAAGLSMDLSEVNLGQGKLVVTDIEVAQQVLFAIRLRQIRGRTLRKSDIVVSADLERVVRSLVMNNPATSRKNQHVTNEPGELVDLGYFYRGRKRHQMLESRHVGRGVHSINWVPAPSSDITCAATTTDANRPALSRARTHARMSTWDTGFGDL